MSWKESTIGDVLSVIKNGINCDQNKNPVGNKITRIETIAKKCFDFERVGYANLSESEKLKSQLKVGDILFSHINSPIHVGKTAIYEGEEDIYHGINLLLMRTKEEIDPYFFNHFLNYLFTTGYWEENCKKSVNQASVNQKDISKVQFRYPPLSIQQKIVAKLDAIFAEIDKATAAAEANARNAEALFQSYLTQVFEHGGEDWKLDKLEKFVDIKHGFAFDGEDFEQSDNEDSPIVLTPGNFTEDGKLNFSIKNTKRLNKIEKISNQFNVGDLVVVMTDLSSKMKILGKPAIVDRENVLHNQRIGLFQFKENTVHKLFLYNFLKTRKYIEAIKATSTGSMVRHTAPKRILATTICYPTMENQMELISKFEDLSIITNNISIYQNRKINELDVLKNSVLAKAFNGDLVKE